MYMADVHDSYKASQVSIWRPQVTIWRPQVTIWRHSDLPLSDLLTTLLRGLGDSLHQKELFISCSNNMYDNTQEDACMHRIRTWGMQNIRYPFINRSAKALDGL